MPSTRLTLRLPSLLADEAARIAKEQGISLNAFLILATRDHLKRQRRELGPIATPLPPRAIPTPAGAVGGVKSWPKVGRNDPCPCGSGRKWKVCHGKP